MPRAESWNGPIKKNYRTNLQSILENPLFEPKIGVQVRGLAPSLKLNAHFQYQKILKIAIMYRYKIERQRP